MLPVDPSPMRNTAPADAQAKNAHHATSSLPIPIRPLHLPLSLFPHLLKAARMLHQAIHIGRQIRHRALGLPGIELGHGPEGQHLPIQDVVAAYDVLDKLAAVDVRVAAGGDVVDDFGGDEDGAQVGGRGVGGVRGG